jgi:3alpha(or 20beta)-hydroxysteroid dehydrogenase
MTGRLDGRVILITGAARGQGAAEAALFVAEGAAVLLADVLDEPGRDVAARLGDRAAYVHLDVTDEAAWSDTIDEACTRFGKLDGLINNAGISVPRRPLTEYSLEEYRRVVDVNQVGVFLGMRAAAPAITDAGGGTIVNVSSIAGMVGIAGSIAYTASKWAVRGMTKTAALELGRLGIRVNSIHPGGVDTPFLGTLLAGRSADEREAARRVAGAGRIGDASEIASLALFLTSGESSMCTGAEFLADDGTTTGLSFP